MSILIQCAGKYWIIMNILVDNLGRLVNGVMDYSDIGKTVKGLLK